MPPVFITTGAEENQPVRRSREALKIRWMRGCGRLYTRSTARNQHI